MLVLVLLESALLISDFHLLDSVISFIHSLCLLCFQPFSFLNLLAVPSDSPIARDGLAPTYFSGFFLLTLLIGITHNYSSLSAAL